MNHNSPDNIRIIDCKPFIFNPIDWLLQKPFARKTIGPLIYFEEVDGIRTLTQCPLLRNGHCGHPLNPLCQPPPLIQLKR